MNEWTWIPHTEEAQGKENVESKKEYNLVVQHAGISSIIHVIELLKWIAEVFI